MALKSKLELNLLIIDLMGYGPTTKSESDRCSRASMFCDVEDGFFEKCHAAEERHRSEMRGWATAAEPDRSFLYEIRALATRQY